MVYQEIFFNSTFDCAFTPHLLIFFLVAGSLLVAIDMVSCDDDNIGGSISYLSKMIWIVI